VSTEDPFDQAVELYRAESDPLMREHFFRLALLRLRPADQRDLVAALTKPDIGELREALSAGKVAG